jgi:hypothetical protein
MTMKPLKTLKAKKLSIKKETLRTLTEGDLKRAAGGAIASQWCGGTSWCSTNAQTKCVINGFSNYCHDL